MMENKLPWDLIISKLRQELSSGEDALFDKWLEQGNNRELFKQLEAVWENVQMKVYDYEPDVEHYWQELSARMKSSSKNVLKEETKPRKQFFLHNISRYFSRVAVIASIVLVATFFLAYYLGKFNAGDAQTYLTYSTQNSKTKVLLPDSTEVWLHNHSAITYSFDKKQQQREVELIGEAYFDVRHDENKPFLVTAGGVEVKVYGTEFNVNSCFSPDEVLVSLVEGSVSMMVDDNTVFLKPGEEGLFDVNSKKISVSEGDMELAKIWTHDKIRFEDKNLRTVCRYLSRWYGISFEVDSEIGDDQSYTFTFKGQSLNEVIDALAGIHSFDYRINEDMNVVLIKKRRSME